MRLSLIAPPLIVLVPAIAQAANPVCALLDPEKSPRAALLEAKLLADPSLTWVERGGIDKVLREQRLQAVFSPQGVGDRVTLGRLLKADLLVMVRPAKDAKEPALEVVVCETAGGLRLLVRAVAVSSNAEADTAALLAAVREGVRKHKEKVAEVVAVPPFVSRDLEFTHDHLKGAFAKLAEGEALNRPGVVVVELAEAEALAREVALAAPGSSLRRPLPVYLLGEYRHEGKGKGQTIGLRLRAERGGKPVGKPEELTLKPDEAPAAVRGWAARSTDALAKGDRPRPPADPKAEAKQLAERAQVFKRLGNWSESLALFEASLLLDPDLNDLHAEAVKVLTPLLSAAFLRAVRDTPGEAATTRRLYNRGLVHIEEFVTRGGDLSRYKGVGGAGLADSFHHSVYWLIDGKTWTAEAKAEMQGIKDDERAVCLRLVPVIARQKRNNFPEWIFLYWAVDRLPRKERYELLERVINDLEGLPDPRARVVAYVRGSVVDSPEYAAFLDRLAASKSQGVREAAAELKANLQVARKAPPFKHVTDPEGHTLKPPRPGMVKFTPIALAFEGSDPTRRAPREVAGVLAVGKGLDVVWTRDGLYRMKKKGTLRLLWRSPGINDWADGRFESVRFDGRHVWASWAQRKKNPTLLIFDPETDKLWDAVEVEGMPQAPVGELVEKFTGASLMVSPLGPGQACAAGAFLDRAWVAVATFDPTTGKAAFKVIHEARDAQDRTDKDQWARSTTTFSPNYMYTFTGPPGGDRKPARRVLIGRTGGQNLVVNEHPLLVDPDRGTVEVVKDRVWFGPRHERSVEADGAVYFMEGYANPASSNHPLTHVARIGFPGLTKEVFCPGLRPSVVSTNRIVAHGGTIHVVLQQHESDLSKPTGPVLTSQWWTIDRRSKKPQLVAIGLPPVQGVWESSHYGIVATVDYRARNAAALNLVEVAEK